MRETLAGLGVVYVDDPTGDVPGTTEPVRRA
jgi:hypothetical protein